MQEKSILEEKLLLGTRLKQSREKIGLTMVEVAARLNLTKSVVVYLESNNYSASSRDVFNRGYLRAYAKLLELPADELVEDYREMIGSDGSISSKSHLIINSSTDVLGSKKSGGLMNFFSEHIKFITVSALILSILVIGVWWHNKFYYVINDSYYSTTEVDFVKQADN